MGLVNREAKIQTYRYVTSDLALHHEMMGERPSNAQTENRHVLENRVHYWWWYAAGMNEATQDDPWHEKETKSRFGKHRIQGGVRARKAWRGVRNRPGGKRRLRAMSSRIQGVQHKSKYFAWGGVWRLYAVFLNSPLHYTEIISIIKNEAI